MIGGLIVVYDVVVIFVARLCVEEALDVACVGKAEERYGCVELWGLDYHLFCLFGDAEVVALCGLEK